MTDYTQTNRLFKVRGESLDADDFLLKSFSGTERLSDSFTFQCVLLSERDTWKAKDILGKWMTVEIEASGGTRHLNGVVSRFAQVGPPEPLAVYQADLVPWTWMMRFSRDCRVFQDLTAPQIIQKVLEKTSRDFRLALSGSYPARTYCVQYRESDLDFVSRLLEEEGIYYFFEHQASKHVLVLADDSPGSKPCAPQAAVRMAPQPGAWQEEDVLLTAQLSSEVHSGKIVTRDYDFERPAETLEVTSDTVSSIPDLSKYEVFDYPGIYADTRTGQALADVRMTEMESLETTLRGGGNLRSMQAGYKFSLDKHFAPDVNGDYLAVEVRHEGKNPWRDDAADSTYSNSFVAIPIATKFRPKRKTPRPVIAGTQTAEVVGPSGQELYTDKYGRVKVQFHWDREGKSDEKSSCWIRVGTPWAGAKFGSVFLPRIGWEVIVSFLDGDPDRPVVTGSLYNGNQMPPYDLPKNQTQAGIKSRTTMDGGAKTFNELRFEDLTDKEEIYLHAERDLTTFVEHNETRTVEGMRSLTVKGQGKASPPSVSDVATIEKGDQKIEVKQGSQVVKIFKDRTVEIATGNLTTKVKAGKASFDAMQEILLKVGGNSIKIDQTGITVKGIKVDIQGQATAQVQAPMTTAKGSAMLTLQGALTKIN